MRPEPSAATIVPVAAHKARKVVSPDDPDYVPGGAVKESPNTRPPAVRLIGRDDVMQLQSFSGSRLVVFGGGIFNCMGDDLRAIDPKTGVDQWRPGLTTWKGAGASESVALPPAAAGDKLFVATRGGHLLVERPTARSPAGWICNRPPRRSRSSSTAIFGTRDGRRRDCVRQRDRKLTGWNQWGGNALHSAVADDSAPPPRERPLRTWKKPASRRTTAAQFSAGLVGLASGGRLR